MVAGRWEPARPSRASPTAAELRRSAGVCSAQQDLGFGLASLVERQRALAPRGADRGAGALHPEQALTDGIWPSGWPGWAGGQPGRRFPPHGPTRAGLQQLCRPRGRRIPREGIPHPPAPQPGSSEAPHGRGTAQVAAGLTMKAFYLNLSC